MKPVLLAAALLCSTASTPSGAQAAPRIALDAATLAALPREAVDAEVHGHVLHCSGVPLVALLRKAGAMPAEPLRGAHLARIVRVSARDGYRAAFSLAELDPTLGNARVFVVDACDGKPLGEHDGPLRLLVPGEQRPARGVRQLQAIEVVDAP
jgi:hypothetical protein